MNLLFDVFKIIPADIYKIIRSVIKIPYVSVAVILGKTLPWFTQSC